MQSLIDHARDFGRRAEELNHLACGQSPQALFIACSDSRVIPSLITGADPGDLFELRTAGGIVPEYRSDRRSGESATIEYAVEILGVTDVVVCGHSHCGAVGALLRGDDLTAVPAVRDWLESEAGDISEAGNGTGAGAARTLDPHIADAVQGHVLAQLDRLRSYPSIAPRLAAGQLRLHGWFYEIDTGSVTSHCPDRQAFLPL
ncbi:carbonic anhydrase [Streptomyces sp. H27-D2]|uniref:carbonic anhydrase n=1 Tax=Streptomyces sp. H27-D2 TaxID=3046304 RepID=UPI002DC02E9D|nr:carbonic anhydrase [Streptomyces sp. H27-D2]MEC4019356.1 carbonic anhydrase [Streptomyces sp. H27-D2]